LCWNTRPRSGQFPSLSRQSVFLNGPYKVYELLDIAVTQDKKLIK
jgi:hypothetical protein